MHGPSEFSPYLNTAGPWRPAYCNRAGALGEMYEHFQSILLHGQDVAARCWLESFVAWHSRTADLKRAWYFVDERLGRNNSKELAAARSVCRSISQRWEMRRVILDIPRYVHDLRGCGRHRRDIWRHIEMIHHKMELQSVFRQPRGLHMCLPAQQCNPSEAAGGPVVLWLSYAFNLHEALFYLPPPLRAHANVSLHETSARSRNRDLFSLCPEPRISTSMVHVRLNGRLGNILLDLANGLVAALQTGRRGVVIEPGASGTLEIASAAADLFGSLIGSVLEVPPGIREDPEVRDVVSRARGGCVQDGPMAAVTMATHWSFDPVRSSCGSVASCAVPLAFRRSLLRAVLLPRLYAPGGACSDLAQPSPAGILTIHLRGGDAVPAGTPEHAQPPCAAYDIALDAMDSLAEGGVVKIRLIAQDDANPCYGHLRDRYADRILEARSGGSLAEDVCAILSSSILFMAASTFDASLALLGVATRVFVMLPSRNFSPGPVTFGFSADQYMDELCTVFPSAVLGFEAEGSYYAESLPSGPANEFYGVKSFTELPAERILHYPAEKLRVRACPEGSSRT